MIIVLAYHQSTTNSETEIIISYYSQLRWEVFLIHKIWNHWIITAHFVQLHVIFLSFHGTCSRSSWWQFHLCVHSVHFSYSSLIFFWMESRQDDIRSGSLWLHKQSKYYKYWNRKYCYSQLGWDIHLTYKILNLWIVISYSIHLHVFFPSHRWHLVGLLLVIVSLPCPSCPRLVLQCSLRWYPDKWHSFWQFVIMHKSTNYYKLWNRKHYH